MISEFKGLLVAICSNLVLETANLKEKLPKLSQEKPYETFLGSDHEHSQYLHIGLDLILTKCLKKVNNYDSPFHLAIM